MTVLLCVQCLDEWDANGVDYRSRQHSEPIVIWYGQSICVKHRRAARREQAQN